MIIAYRLDGEYMPVCEREPLWIFHPQDDYPNLRRLGVGSRMTWQLRSLRVLE